MTNNDLRIKITGVLNTGATIGEINIALKGIEKKINKLKLKVEIDEKVLQSFASFANTFSKLDNAFHDTTKNIINGNKLQLKSIKDTGDGYEKVTKQIEKYNKESKKIGEVTTIADKNNIKTKTIRTDGDGKLLGYTETYNAEKEMQLTKKQADEQQKVIEQIAKAREKSTIKQRQEEKKQSEQQAKAINKNIELSHKEKVVFEQNKESIRQSLKKVFDQGKVNEKFFSNFNKVIDGTKNVKEIEKVEEALKRVNQHADNKTLQQKLINQSETLMRTHRKTVDMGGTSKLVEELKQINPAANSASNALQKAQTQLKGFENGAREAARMSMSFKDMFSTAMTKFPINNLGGSKTSLIAGIPLEPFKLQRKDEISLIVNV